VSLYRERTGFPHIICDLSFFDSKECPKSHIFAVGELEGQTTLTVHVKVLGYGKLPRRWVQDIYGHLSHVFELFYDLCVFNRHIDFHLDYETVALVGRFELSEVERFRFNTYLNHFTYIYLIRDIDSGLTKIGRSDSPQKRLQTLTRQPTLLPKPHNFQLLCESRMHYSLEDELHQIFSERRVRGEWFDLTEQDIENIRLYHFFENSKPCNTGSGQQWPEVLNG
jgi:hypothetical protein